MRLKLDHPWLVADLGAAMPVLSWAPGNPGLVRARHIAWREVRNADLPEGFDVQAWFAEDCRRAGLGGAVAMLTSREIARRVARTAEMEGARVDVVATVGLGNAERVGHRRADPAPLGTINIALRLSAGLAAPARLEALSIAAEARTAAVLAAGLALPAGAATGTGTDCIALAAPDGATAHAGKHTAIGAAIGRAVHDAVAAGAADWCAEMTANGGIDAALSP